MELALLYAAVADMALKPTGSDLAFLVPAGVILVALAANAFFRSRSSATGTTEG